MFLPIFSVRAVLSKVLIGNVKKSLFEGGIFVVIVLFLFLANVRTTVISLVTLPISLLVSILTLHYMGLTIIR